MKSFIHGISETLKVPVPYQWRVQSRSKDKSKAFCSAFIDARQVMDVLDVHCIYGWESAFKDIGGFIFAGIGIYDENAKIYWKWDCGARVENDEKDQMYEQAGKSAASDAFKRAAVQWGIGRFLYDMPMVTVACDQYGNPIDNKGERVWDLTKHINSLKQGAYKEIKKAPEPAPTPSEEKTSSEIQPLQPKQFDAMIKAISEGKIKEVEEALPKYKLNLAQKTALTKLIKDAKS
jgi:hypothetical protein